MPRSTISTYSKSTVWVDCSDEESDEEDLGARDLKALELQVSNVTKHRYNPFLNDRQGFSLFQLYGRKKRGRPTKIKKLLPVSEQEAEKKNPRRPRPAGVEVKRYLDELKEFTALDARPKSKLGRKRAFGCPKNRDFEPTVQVEEVVGAVGHETVDQFQPCLFDFVQMDANWKEAVMIANENELPKPKIGRPRIHPIKDKVPGKCTTIFIDIYFFYVANIVILRLNV
jgi:hypothetical protein